jgi:hypothetical protein
MEIYNKGSRDIIIARKDVISGIPETMDKERAHITPDMVCEVSDATGEDLIRRYPKEIFRWGKQPAA